MIKAAAGLVKVYGYTTPLPGDPTDLEYFDDCVLWTRQAIDWLVRFSRREQFMILPVSVRNVVGEHA